MHTPFIINISFTKYYYFFIIVFYVSQLLL